MYVKQLKIRLAQKMVLSVCSFALAFGTLFAQNIKVTGVVVDKNNEPVIGASIVIKGTRTMVPAGLDGTFTIEVPANATLEVSAIGYVKQEIPVRNRTRFDITLDEDSALLDAALVTAEYGMKRVARAVGASIQTVRSADVVDSGRDNFITALQGRIAGLNVSAGGGLPGSSTSVVLRTYTSISGNNQPLYVIDGIPINNSTFDPVSGFAGGGLDPRQQDFSSRGNDFNPDDIESISVLKGAAAAALYGSEASNGAIVITTKKGTATGGKGKVSYRSSMFWSKAYGYPEIQDKYGNGAYGTTNYYYQTRMGGLLPPDVPIYNNFDAVLQTGFKQQHNLSVESGTDKMSIRASAAVIDETAIVKTMTNKSLNLSLSGKAEITKWLSFESSMSYKNGAISHRPGKGTAGPLYRATRWPTTDNMAEYMDPDGQMKLPSLYIDTDLLNPLYAMHKNLNTEDVDNFLTTMSVRVKPTQNLFMMVNMGWNNTFTRLESGTHPYYGDRQSSSYGNGSYRQTKVTTTDTNLSAFIGYQNTWNKFSINAMAGYVQREDGSQTMGIYGNKFQVIEFFGIENCDPQSISVNTYTRKRRIQAISGQAELGWNDMVFVTLTGRNDWSSSLPKQNNHYFYPSIQGSFIASDLPFLKKSSVISFLKLRATYSQVGRNPNALAIYPRFEAAGTVGGGFRYGYTGPNESLKPEMQTEKEVGFEARLFNDRMSATFTRYWQRSDDQYVTDFRLSYATGFVLNNMNVGSFTTKGWDLNVEGDVLRTASGLRWNLGFNIAHATSLVVYLPENVTEYYDAYTWAVDNSRGGVKVGYPLTSMTGLLYLRNDKGDILINPATGIPVIDSEWSYMGDRDPKFRYGINTRLSYQGFSLSALALGNLGANVMNGTKRDMLYNGSSWESVTMRESGPVVFKGVLRNGLENTSNPTINSIAVDFSNYAGGSYYVGSVENWFEKNINYLRLAEVRLTYTVPGRWLSNFTKQFLTYANIWFAANDLFVLTNYSGIDAVGNSGSASLGGAGGMGIDNYAIPYPRSFSLGISLTF